MKKTLANILFIIALLTLNSFGFEKPNIEFKNIKIFQEFKSSFKKKKQEVLPKMVETKEDWEIDSQNVPLIDRKLDRYKEPKSDKKNYYPRPNYVLEKYNNPPGKRSFDIDAIKKDLKDYPPLVVDNEFHYLAYSQFYFAPDVNQISSAFFVEKLPKDITKSKQILNYKHCKQERTPVLESGTKEIYKDLFNSLSLVDFSHDGKKVLFKEQIGSAFGGIYKTNLYVHFIEFNNDEIPQDEGETIKLDDLDKTIKNFLLDTNNIQLQKYRYTLEPLGFSSDNDDLIIVLSYVYDNNNNKIFLGAWGYNCLTYEILLLSRTNEIYSVSSNGIMLNVRYGD